MTNGLLGAAGEPDFNEGELCFLRDVSWTPPERLGSADGDILPGIAQTAGRAGQCQGHGGRRRASVHCGSDISRRE